jgi:hypothetical protein
MFIAYNVLNMFRGGNIDHAAHAGGLVAGIACGLLISQPLGPQVRASRWWKSLLTGGVGAAALCGAVFFLPPAPPAPLNVRAEFQAFTAAEQKAMTTFQTLAKANDDGQLTNVEFADRIEQEVLPAWAAARMRLEKLRAEPMAKQNVVAKVAQYAGEREQAWRLFAAAARENDEEKLRQATNQWRAADATARSIGQ